MVVQSRGPVEPAELDLGYLALFLGLRVNECVVDKMAALGFVKTRQSHGYVIEHLIEEDRTITQLAARMEVTQQAASKVVAAMVRLGLIEMTASKDRRVKRIRLSESGWQSVKQARKVRAGIEKRLVKAVGVSVHRDARVALMESLKELGGIGRTQSRRVKMAD